MYSLKKHVCILLIFTILLSGFSVNAESSDTPESHDSIVQINYGYLFEDGSFDVFASAPGIVVNSKTVITYDFTTDNDDILDRIHDRTSGYEAVEIDTRNKRKFIEKLNYAIYTDEKKYVNVDIKDVEKVTSTAGNILILHTEEDLTNPIVFSRLAENETIESEKLRVVGLNKDILTCEYFVEYNEEKTKGIYKDKINITSEEDNVIEFSAEVDYVFVGGAIINEKTNELYGFVVDVDENGRWGKAVPVNSLMNILDQAHVMYNLGEKIADINYDFLHTVTDAAEQIDKQIEKKEVEYTEDSQANFKDKLVNAKKIYEENDVKQEDVDLAATELNEAMLALEEVSKTGKASFIIALIVICLVIILIVVIVVLYFEKRELLFKLLGVKPKEGSLANSNNKITGFYKGKTKNQMSDAPYIIRMVDASKIVINKDGFTVGRDFGVDCRIPENISISKCHCTFNKFDDQWYIVDNASSNKTFVNNVVINPNEPVALHDKTEIMLGNEKFIFRYEKEVQQVTQEEDLNMEVPDTGILAFDDNSAPVEQTVGFTDLDVGEMNTTVLPGSQSSEEAENPWL